MDQTTMRPAFQPRDFVALQHLSRSSSTYGVFSVSVGSIALAIAIPLYVMGLRTDPKTMVVAAAVGSAATVALVAGLRYITAGIEIAKIGRAGTNGVEETVRGFDALGRVFRLEAIVTGLSIAFAFAAGAIAAGLQAAQ